MTAGPGGVLSCTKGNNLISYVVKVNSNIRICIQKSNLNLFYYHIHTLGQLRTRPETFRTYFLFKRLMQTLEYS